MAVNLFDTQLYRDLYPDLKQAGLTSDAQLRDHFLNFGANEGRVFSRFADLKYYNTSYSDLKNAGLTTNRQLFEHMEQFGAAEGRRLGASFNVGYYRAAYQDLAQANLNNEILTAHYQSFGSKEGRLGSEFFNPVFYLDTYADLKAAFGNDYQRAALHFFTNGINEGRVGSGPVAPAFNPGEIPGTAYELGALFTQGTINEFVGTSDPQDFYSFVLDKPGNLNVTLSDLTAGATLKLFADINGNGQIDVNEELTSASGTSSNPAVINKNLAQGVYMVDVVTGSPTTNTSYTLNLAKTNIPALPIDPGNTFGTAFDAGTLIGNENRSYQDAVGTNDRSDFYRFALTGFSRFRLFSSSSEPTVANLYADKNNNGAIDAGELLGTSSSPVGAVIAQTLNTGTYFVEIASASATDNSTYNLSLESQVALI